MPRTPNSSELVLTHVQLGPQGRVGHVRIVDSRIAAITADLPTKITGEIVDASGHTVLPGFWDAHVHIVQWACARRRVDLSGARSARAAADLMAAAARDGQHTPGQPLVGFGYRDGLWPDRPDPSLLAWASDDQVVALVSNDLHAAWLSRGALRALNRPADHPTGVLLEDEGMAAVARLSQTTPEIMDEWVVDAVRAAAARGVVGFVDFEYGDTVSDWRRRASRHPLDARVRCAIYPDHLEDAIAQGLRTTAPVPQSDGLVEVGWLKLFVDGSLNTRTALCDDPYPDNPSDDHRFGLLQTPPPELERLMARAAAHGIQPAVHAIGDRANSIALDAFDRVGCRGRIEHAQLVHRSDLLRFARPGLVLGVQPAHATDDRDVADRHWAGRTDRAFAYADLLRAGARIEIGSDAPVSPMDPWQGIASAVHRTDDDRDPWHPEQAIGLADALAAASGGRRELRVGEPADLVLVGHDPAGLAKHELREMPVAGTLLAGRWTHRAF